MSLLFTRRRFGALLSAIPAVSLTSAVAAGPRLHAVKVRQFVFEPAELVIAVGDSVKWTNFDFAPHTATSDDYDWDTGELEKNDEGIVKFETAGKFPYFCVFHPHMKGRIVVKT